MDEATSGRQFQLSPGGPLHGLLVRMHLLETDRYRVGLRVAIFLGLTWIPLLLLSALGGALAAGSTGLPFLVDPIPHARHLIALPLLLAAEAIIDPLLDAAVRYLDTSGIVPEEELPRYRAAVAKIALRRDSVWAESIVFVLSFGVSWFSHPGYSALWLNSKVSSWAWSATAGGSRLTPAGWWYLVVSAPFLQFLLYRWVWRFWIWVSFLRSVSQLTLTLLASHSDRSGGLILVGRSQLGFVALFVAIAAMMSAVLAQEILYSGYELKAAVPAVIGYVVFSFAVIFGPLLFFSPQLIQMKRQALWDYGALQCRLSSDFHRHWITGAAADLVDSGQASAMADYGMVYEAVSSVRFVPIRPRWAAMAGLLILAPFAPLLLTKYSIVDIVQRILGSFV